jgi:hypothetical protein
MFDPMGRMAGQMPMTSYAGNNALGGLAAANYGQMAMRPQGAEFAKRGMMNPQFAPGEPAPGGQNALAQYGMAAPLTFNAQGLPQQFTDWQGQMNDWQQARPQRPQFERPEMPAGGWQPGMFQQMRDQFRDQRQDWRGQMRDWRDTRPQWR